MGEFTLTIFGLGVFEVAFGLGGVGVKYEPPLKSRKMNQIG